MTRPPPSPTARLACAVALGLLPLLAGCGERSDHAPSGTEASDADPSQGAAVAAPPTTPSLAAAIPGLTLGAAVPPGSPWHRDGAQISDACLTYASAALPGAYAIVIAGKVERVSFGPDAPFILPSGIGPGATEAAVRRAYPDLLAEPHKYQEAPAKYLTSPHLTPGEPGLRFEIGTDGMVEQLHIGLPGTLELVEGCA